MDLVIYHNACPDGFAAAYVAHKRWPEATFMPRNHGMEPPYAEVEGKDVLVVDFSWRTSLENCELARRAKSFRILDHHKSAAEILKNLSFATFDMNRSGAGLAWDYLFGVDRPHEPDDFGWTQHYFRPWWIDYVEDRDLWRWALQDSRAVNAFIGACRFDFDVWDRTIGKVTADQAAEYGRWILQQIEKYVEQGVEQAQYGKLFYVDSSRYVNQYRVAVVNALYMNISELAGALSEQPGIDIGMGWFERQDGKIQFSLRTRNSNVDVSQIAQSRNGGGHKSAAGFTVSIAEGRNLIDSILGRGPSDAFFAPMNSEKIA